jgi:hypothetical protein
MQFLCSPIAAWNASRGAGVLLQKDAHYQPCTLALVGCDFPV